MIWYRHEFFFLLFHALGFSFFGAGVCMIYFSPYNMLQDPAN